MELCDIDGMSSYGVVQQLATFSSVLRNLMDLEGQTTWTPRRALLLGCSFFFPSGGVNAFRQTVLDTCTTMGAAPFAAGAGDVAPQQWELLDCLITASTGAPGALLIRGGVWSLDTVQINNAGGDAVDVTGAKADVILNNVTGTGNAGFGVHITNGGSVQVRDNATVVTGTGGDMKVGSLAVRTWANFRGVAPIGNQYDIVSPPVAGTTGGRLFQAP
jgi:hypothetical protein